MKNSSCLKKLRSRAGESIAETLVALVISALALLMLAGAITSASRVVERSKAAMTNYYEADNALAQTATKKGDVSITIKDDADSISQTFVDVPYYLNDTLGAVEVISYSLPEPTPTPLPVGP